MRLTSTLVATIVDVATKEVEKEFNRVPTEEECAEVEKEFNAILPTFNEFYNHLTSQIIKTTEECSRLQMACNTLKMMYEAQGDRTYWMSSFEFSAFTENMKIKAENFRRFVKCKIAYGKGYIKEIDRSRFATDLRNKVLFLPTRGKDMSDLLKDVVEIGKGMAATGEYYRKKSAMNFYNYDL